MKHAQTFYVTHPFQKELNCLLVIPETPSRDTNSHDDVDDHLCKENEEEDEEIEGAVTPRVGIKQL